MGSAWSAYIDRTQCVQKAQLEKWPLLALVAAAGRAQVYANKAADADPGLAVSEDEIAAERPGHHSHSRALSGAAVTTASGEMTSRSDGGSTSTAPPARGRIRDLYLTRIQFHDIFVDFSYIVPILLANASKPAQAAPSTSAAAEMPVVPSTDTTANAASKELEEAIASVTAFKGLRDELFDAFLPSAAVKIPDLAFGTRRYDDAMRFGPAGDPTLGTRVRAVDVFCALILMCRGVFMHRLAFLYLLFSDAYPWDLSTTPDAQWLAATSILQVIEAMPVQISVEQIHDLLLTVATAMKRVGISVADVKFCTRDLEAAIAALPRTPTVPGKEILSVRKAVAAKPDGANATADAVGGPSATNSEQIHGGPGGKTGSAAAAAEASTEHKSGAETDPARGPTVSSNARQGGSPGKLLRRHESSRALVTGRGQQSSPPPQRRSDALGPIKAIHGKGVISFARINKLRTMFADGLDDDASGLSGIIIVRRVLEVDAISLATPAGILLPGRALARLAKLAKVAAAQEMLATSRETSRPTIAQVAALALLKSSAAQAGTAFAGQQQPAPAAEKKMDEAGAAAMLVTARGRQPGAARASTSTAAPKASQGEDSTLAAVAKAAASASPSKQKAANVIRGLLRNTAAVDLDAPEVAAAMEILLPGTGLNAASSDYKPNDTEWAFALAASCLEAPERWRHLTAYRRKALQAVPGGRTVKHAAVLMDHYAAAETHITLLAAEISLALTDARRVVSDVEAELATRNALPPPTSSHGRLSSASHVVNVLQARLQLKASAVAESAAATVASPRPGAAAAAASAAVAQAPSTASTSPTRGAVNSRGHHPQRRNSVGGGAEGGSPDPTALGVSETRIKNSFEMLRKYETMLVSPVPFLLFLDWCVAHPVPRYVLRQLCFPMGRIATYNGMDYEVAPADARNRAERDPSILPGQEELERARALAKAISTLGIDVQDLRKIRKLLQNAVGMESSGVAYDRFRRIVMGFMADFLVERKESAMMWNYHRSKATSREDLLQLGPAPRLPPYGSMTELQRKKLIQKLFELFDVNGDDRVEIGEFSLTLAGIMRGSPYDKLGLMFDVYDVDADGEVGPDELEAIIIAAQSMSDRQRASQDQFTDEMERRQDSMEFARELAEALDVNGDGSITREEFLQILRVEPLLYECFAASLNLPLGSLDEPLPEHEQPKSGPVFDFVMLHLIRNSYSIDVTRNRGATTSSKSAGGRRGASMSEAGDGKGGKAGGDSSDGAMFAIDMDDGHEADGDGEDGGARGGRKRKGASILERAVDRHHFRRLLRDVWKCPEDALFLADRVFDYMDEDGSGSIDVRELYRGITSALRGPLHLRSDFFYSLFDVEGDGHLKSAEILRMLLASAGRDDVSEADARRVLAKIDTDGSGTVEREEFLQAIEEDPGLLDALSRVFGTVSTLNPSTLLTAAAEEAEAEAGDLLEGHELAGLAGDAATDPAQATQIAGSAGVSARPLSRGVTLGGNQNEFRPPPPALPARPLLAVSLRVPRVQRYNISAALSSSGALGCDSSQVIPASPAGAECGAVSALPQVGGTGRGPTEAASSPAGARPGSQHEMDTRARPRSPLHMIAPPKQDPVVKTLGKMVNKATTIDRRVEHHITQLARDTEVAPPAPNTDEEDQQSELQQAIELARALAERPAGSPYKEAHAGPTASAAASAAATPARGTRGADRMQRSPRSSAAAGLPAKDDSSPPHSPDMRRPRNKKQYVYDDGEGAERWYKRDPDLPRLIHTTKDHASRTKDDREAVMDARRTATAAEKSLMAQVAEMMVRERARHAEVRRTAAAGKLAELAAHKARGTQGTFALPPPLDIGRGDDDQMGLVSQSSAADGIHSSSARSLSPGRGASSEPQVSSIVPGRFELEPTKHTPKHGTPTPLTVALLGDLLTPHSPRRRSPRDSFGVGHVGGPRSPLLAPKVHASASVPNSPVRLPATNTTAASWASSPPLASALLHAGRSIMMGGPAFRSLHEPA